MADAPRIHFFKSSSRFGMINLPYGEDTLNLGVEHGPDAVLTPEFVAQFEPKSVVESYEFPIPESITPPSYRRVLAQTLGEFTLLINDKIQVGERQVMVGGDHSTAFSTVAAVLKRYDPVTVGYIQFDSHGDLHQFASSPSGNFHGMWGRAIVDTFDDTNIDRLIPRKLSPEQMLYVGNLQLEEAEIVLMRERGIRSFSRADLIERRQAAHSQFEEFVARYPHIHVSFDIDVFDRKLAPATGTPAHDGLQWDDVAPLLKILSKRPSISIDLVEVNPDKEGAAETITLGQKVLTSLLTRMVE